MLAKSYEIHSLIDLRLASSLVEQVKIDMYLLKRSIEGGKYDALTTEGFAFDLRKKEEVVLKVFTGPKSFSSFK